MISEKAAARLRQPDGPRQTAGLGWFGGRNLPMKVWLLWSRCKKCIVIWGGDEDSSGILTGPDSWPVPNVQACISTTWTDCKFEIMCLARSLEEKNDDNDWMVQDDAQLNQLCLWDGDRAMALPSTVLLACCWKSHCCAFKWRAGYNVKPIWHSKICIQHLKWFRLQKLHSLFCRSAFPVLLLFFKKGPLS